MPQLLAFSQVRNNPHCLSQSLTTGALFSPRLCRGSFWVGLGQSGVPLVLTNQVPSGKSTSRTQRVQMNNQCSHQEYRDLKSCLLSLHSVFEIFTLSMVDVSYNEFSMSHKYMVYYFAILKLMNIYFGHLALWNSHVPDPSLIHSHMEFTVPDPAPTSSVPQMECQMLNGRIEYVQPEHEIRRYSVP